MTLRHFQIFVTVFETLNFTQAGKKLFIAQPAVSLAIKELEEFYGVRLFDRLKHTIYPTEQGKQLYKYARKILDMVNEMEDLTKQWDDKSPIVIAGSITIGNQILPHLIKEFKKEYPHTPIQVIVHNVSTIEQYILQNKIDIALIETSPSTHHLKSIPFLEDHLCTVAHITHPLAHQKNIDIHLLEKENILTREKGSSVREVVESLFMTHQIKFTPIWESTSTQALIKAVEQNLGITTLPYRLLSERYDIHKIALLDIPQLNINRTYHIVYHKDKYLSEPMKNFIKLCQQIYK